MTPKCNIKITIVGGGYVGMSLASLLGEHHDVTIFDINIDRVDIINEGLSPIKDSSLVEFLEKKEISLNATLNRRTAYKDADFVIICTPTDYDDHTKKFNTGSVDKEVEKVLEVNKDCLIVIKSTIPVGHTKQLQEQFKTNRIIFSPEFLREGKAIYDNLNPSRIIIGGNCNKSRAFGDLLLKISKNHKTPVLYLDSTEAEAIKLFSNTYLAMRVAFINELDTFALSNNLDSSNLIRGISLDSRIGSGYNNPSFGYGGYCLPKDTKQLLANYKKVPQTLIKAIVSSNETRKDFIADIILKNKPMTVGFYRLVMKKGSDNYRSSAVIGIIDRLKNKNISILIYEPELKKNIFEGCKIISDLNELKDKSDLIISNRASADLFDVKHKCFSRDLYGEN